MKSILLVIILLTSFQCYAQTNFRTIVSGSWDDAATWQVESPNGSGTWVAAGDFPTSSANIITIRSPHTVTVTSPLTIDQTTIQSGAFVVIQNDVGVTVSDGSGIDLICSGTLNIEGESFIDGAGSFILMGGGILRLGSLNPTGAITAGTGPTGNVRITTRAFNSGANIYYSGLGPQVLGDGHPTDKILNTIIDNPNDVSVNSVSSTVVSVRGNISVINGDFIIQEDGLKTLGIVSTIDLNGGNLVVNSSTGTKSVNILNLTLTNGNFQCMVGANPLYLTINGNVSLLNGDFEVSNSSVLASIQINGNLALIGGDVILTSGTANLILAMNGDVSGTQHIVASGANTDLSFTGAGSLTHAFPIASGSVLESLTYDRTGGTFIIPYIIQVQRYFLLNGTIDSNTNLIIYNTLDLAAGTTFDFSNQTLQIRGSFNKNLSGGSLLSSSLSTLNITGTGATGTLIFAPANLLGTLTINRGNSSSVVSLNGPVTITSALNLTRGILNNVSGLSMATGSTLTRAPLCSMSGLAPANGPYNLVYTGTTVSSGLESLGPLNNVNSNLTGTLTLTNAITAEGSMTINSGILNAGANAITIGTLTNSGTFIAPSSTLTLSGNLTSTGSFSLGTCNLVLTGTSDQSITTVSPLQFNNITLTKTSGTVSLNSNQNLRGVLTVSSGATFDADGASNSSVFTILSVGDAAGSDGSIATLPIGASIMGNVTVQRYWSALDDVYRYISSPVENSTISQLQDSGIPVTGGFEGTSFPCTGCDNDYINLGWYDETVPGYIWEGYQIMPADGNDNTEELVPGRGYELYMWNGVASSLWSARGTVNQGSYPLEVSLTITPPDPPNDYSTEDGWNMVGNPYPSSILWNDNTDLPGGWSMTNIDPVVWVWDVAAEGWKFFDAATNSGDLPGGKIATGQAFWVYATGASPSLTVHEAAKTPVSGAYYRQRESSLLAIKISGNGSIEDNAYLTFDEELRNVPKFSRGVEAISLALYSNEGDRLARFSTDNSAAEIAISALFKNEGEYKFSFASEGSGDWDAYYLVDRYLGKSIKINQSYSFEVTKNSETFENRFFISRRPEIYGENVLSVSVYPNPVTSSLNIDVTDNKVASVSLLNNVGQSVKTSNANTKEGIGSVRFDVVELPKGLYYVKIVGLDQKVYIHKVIKQ